MSLGDWARLTALLGRLGREPATVARDGRARQERDVTLAGLRCDLFLPSPRPRQLVVALHGVTVNGKDDARLQHFARCLSLSGALCVVPNLPRLTQLAFDTSDLGALAALVQQTARRYGRRVGLVGFSYGASYALLAAARPDIASQVAFVLAVGGYASLPALEDFDVSLSDGALTGDAAWDDYVYLHLVCARRHADALGLSAELRADCDSLLRRYCGGADLAQKKAFYRSRLKPLDAVRFDYQRRDAEMARALSPAGQLSGLACGAAIVHDPRDTLVPATHARQLYDELRRLPGGERHRLLVTSLLRHVSLEGALKPAEVVELLRVFSVLVREDG